MASIPLRSSSAMVRAAGVRLLNLLGERLLDDLLVLVQERALVRPELEVVVPPLDRHELACDEDRYRILSKSVRSGRSPVPGGRQVVRYRPRSLISEHPCVGFARELACFGYCLDAGQAHTHSVGITVFHVPGERILAAIRVLLREPETHVGRARGHIGVGPAVARAGNVQPHVTRIPTGSYVRCVARRNLVRNELFNVFASGWSGLLLKQGDGVLLERTRLRFWVLLGSQDRDLRVSDAPQQVSEPWAVFRPKLNSNLDHHFRFTSATLRYRATVARK